MTSGIDFEEESNAGAMLYYTTDLRSHTFRYDVRWAPAHQYGSINAQLLWEVLHRQLDQKLGHRTVTGCHEGLGAARRQALGRVGRRQRRARRGEVLRRAERHGARLRPARRALPAPRHLRGPPGDPGALGAGVAGRRRGGRRRPHHRRRRAAQPLPVVLDPRRPLLFRQGYRGQYVFVHKDRDVVVVRFGEATARSTGPRSSGGATADERQGGGGLPHRLRRRLRVAKVYSRTRRTAPSRTARSTPRAARVRNSRDQRAIDKRSRHGRAQDEAAWRSTEVDMIYRLRDAGVRPRRTTSSTACSSWRWSPTRTATPRPRLGELRFSPRRGHAHLRPAPHRGGAHALRRRRPRRPVGLQRAHGRRRPRGDRLPPGGRRLEQPETHASSCCATSTTSSASSPSSSPTSPRARTRSRCGSSTRAASSRPRRGSAASTARPSAGSTPPPSWSWIGDANHDERRRREAKGLSMRGAPPAPPRQDDRSFNQPRQAPPGSCVRTTAASTSRGGQPRLQPAAAGQPRLHPAAARAEFTTAGPAGNGAHPPAQPSAHPLAHQSTMVEVLGRPAPGDGPRPRRVEVVVVPSGAAGGRGRSRGSPRPGLGRAPATRGPLSRRPRWRVLRRVEPPQTPLRAGPLDCAHRAAVSWRAHGCPGHREGPRGFRGAPRPRRPRLSGASSSGGTGACRPRSPGAARALLLAPREALLEIVGEQELGRAALPTCPTGHPPPPAGARRGAPEAAARDPGAALAVRLPRPRPRGDRSPGRDLGPHAGAHPRAHPPHRADRGRRDPPGAAPGPPAPRARRRSRPTPSSPPSTWSSSTSRLARGRDVPPHARRPERGRRGPRRGPGRGTPARSLPAPRAPRGATSRRRRARRRGARGSERCGTTGGGPSRGGGAAGEGRAARSERNNVRSALLCVRAGATDEARADAEALAQRLDRALRAAAVSRRPPAAEFPRVASTWRPGPRRSSSWPRTRWRAKACSVAWRRACSTTCSAPASPARSTSARSTWSTGRSPWGAAPWRACSPRPARSASPIPRLGVPEASRKRLAELTAAARHRAGEILREEMRPRVEQALVGVGFRPENIPERVGLAKLVELLDQASLHGHTNLGQLRDAVSRNQLKMHDLTGPGELLHGDALLSADARSPPKSTASTGAARSTCRAYRR